MLDLHVAPLGLPMSRRFRLFISAEAILAARSDIAEGIRGNGDPCSIGNIGRYISATQYPEAFRVLCMPPVNPSAWGPRRSFQFRNKPSIPWCPSEPVSFRPCGPTSDCLLGLVGWRRTHWKDSAWDKLSFSLLSQTQEHFEEVCSMLLRDIKGSDEQGLRLDGGRQLIAAACVKDFFRQVRNLDLCCFVDNDSSVESYLGVEPGGKSGRVVGAGLSDDISLPCCDYIFIGIRN
ncbi:hypothetical protein F5Y17DRAFT_255654 [Xylariaceae sp. FL0594]|nr:hypothetical protein F5Y17DRAFT_255654 [Xylariaceae sp. FL0594]